MRSIAFIVTKPLQLLIALSIIRQLGIARETHVVIVDAFANAGGVFASMGKLDWEFSELALGFAADMADAYQFVHSTQQIKELYIDGDVSPRRYLSLARLKVFRDLSLFVYEEGLGTYRNDLYRRPVAAILHALGIGTYFGGSNLVSTVYVCDASRYAAAHPYANVLVEQIRAGPVEMISRFRDELYATFHYRPLEEPFENKCNIYLSSWLVDDKIVDWISKKPGDMFLKPHPHISTHNIQCGKCHIVDATAPAEMLVLDAMDRYASVTVFHHGSSIAQYLPQKESVLLHDLKNPVLM